MIQWSCLKAPEYPIEPIISFISVSNSVIKQSQFNGDSTYITFGFTDGDGDLGDQDSVNIFVTDQRTNIHPTVYKIPFLKQNNGAKGISGEIRIRLFSECCIYPNGQVPCTPSTEFPTDTLIYSIYIKDRAGHQSNIIYTTPIVLLCQ
ncbi:MAG TPA: hypothetical protein PLC60_01600 [Saprospiraceae bacterium]|nr:MAG: hypothetical protein HWD63_09010 [Candidatus Parvibacillus calidus]HNB61261.1 hypothetical protein [Saprospiraceae bacterium]